MMVCDVTVEGKKVFPVSLLPSPSHSLSHTPYFKLQEKELPEERKALLDLIFLLLFHRALCFFYEGLKWGKLFSFQGSSLHSVESEAAAALQDLIHFTPQTDPHLLPHQHTSAEIRSGFTIILICRAQGIKTNFMVFYDYVIEAMKLEGA